MGCLRISSIHTEIVNLFLMKCRQGLSSSVKKVIIALFLQIFISRWPKTQPWLDLSINFNQCIINLSRILWRGLIIFEFNNHLVFNIGFNWVSISKIASPPLQTQSWISCLGGFFCCCCSRGNCLYFFQFLFWFILE